MVSQAIGRPLNWETDDIALQNIQARVRSPGVWMLANLHNALLLSTSNRSEAAVGYATMDGDTCGGLSPIAGIDKAFLRPGSAGWKPPAPPASARSPLSAVNEQAPPPSCARQEQTQTDEDDLMPYDLLDAIERAAIRDRKTPPRSLHLHARPVPAIHRRSSSASGSSASSSSGAATSGSASATPPASTSTTRISTPRPGAGSRSSAAASSANLRSCVSTSGHWVGKSENQNPKSKQNPKPEVRNPNQ